MPAHRSRTEHWLDCMRKIQERGGALEISLDQGHRPVAEAAAPATASPVPLAGGDPSLGGGLSESRPTDEDGAPIAPWSDVIWRVKLLAVKENEIVVEPPGAFGATVSLQGGAKLIGAMTVGQNRWMFHTRVAAVRGSAGGPPGRGEVLVLEPPTDVERCSRRNFYRMSTADLRLPVVQCWPLMDPTSAAPAEAANRLAIEEILAMRGVGAFGGTAPPVDPTSILLPDVGPMFTARMVNLSGGGVGLRVNPGDASAVSRRPHLWVRLDLTPAIPAPVAVTARTVHTHIDSTQHLYVGLAFDFAYNPGHQRFVIDLFTGYVERLQSRQKLNRAG